MRVFVFGDVHEGTSRFKQVEEQGARVWQWVIDVVEEYRCSMVFFLGDRFKSRDPEGVVRDRSDAGLLSLVKQVPVIAICGNHDFYYKSSNCCNYGILNDDVVRKLGLVVVADSFEVEIGGRLIEFLSYNSKPRCKASWLFMHHEVEGLSKWATGLSKSEIAFYERIFSGHIHARIEYLNVQYIGVPFQQSFQDLEPCGGLVLDIVTGQMQWIDFPGRVRFIVLDDLSNVNDLTNCVVRTTKPELYERMLELGALHVEVVWKDEIALSRGSAVVVEKLNWDEVIREYLEVKGKGGEQDYFDFAKGVVKEVMR